jgi:hypothetical protein
MQKIVQHNDLTMIIFLDRVLQSEDIASFGLDVHVYNLEIFFFSKKLFG